MLVALAPGIQLTMVVGVAIFTFLKIESAITCYDSPEEPHAEPGIFQSRCRLFGIMVESQVITYQKPNARQENSQTSKGRYLSIRKSTKGHRQKSNPNKGCRLQLSQLSGLQFISYRIML